VARDAVVLSQHHLRVVRKVINAKAEIITETRFNFEVEIYS
jgi:hypothetical protein